MKLATLRDGRRDGQLVAVSRKLSHRLPATGKVVNLRAAHDLGLILAPWLGAIAAKAQRVAK